MTSLPRENECWIASDGARLFGRLRPGLYNRGVVVAHPHPLYGGSMDNPVVTAMADAYARCGYATLRFDFRGVGHSSGRFDHGRGELADMAAAAAALTGHGYARVALAGYSFGAWMVACALAGGQVARLIIHQVTLVAPPVSLLAFPDTVPWPEKSLILAGDADAFAPIGQLRSMADRWGLSEALCISAGTDHFWCAALPWLASSISDHLSVSSDC